ncbi:short-chain dehydrogenase [Longibacter salinarum]|uniref:Short-chain dehydrogenase n=1 Tax=Longibacter salinarum TaxID=1850348 RepID=A0A2A8CWS1_9BACT|nr:glucose 1-dehydrogenase [Longibacter salinarum]PEN12838.1 short-chain dehydrogenase [Longibacter salinarum]
MPDPNARFDVQDRVVLITGASRGIGRAFAEAFADAGARVVLTSRTQETLDEVASDIEADGGTALPVAAHVGEIDAIDDLLDTVDEAFGGVDVLINNAATNPHFGPLLTAEDSHWDKTFDVNVKGYWRMVKACYPRMKARGGGKVINIASVAGEQPMAGMGVYGVTKAGVLMLTKTLAAELAQANVQVNAIVPGFIKTKFSKAIWANDDLSESVLKSTPQHRMADPDELAGLALYLGSPASDFVTGSAFRADGGLLVGSGMLE